MSVLPMRTMELRCIRNLTTEALLGIEQKWIVSDGTPPYVTDENARPPNAVRVNPSDGRNTDWYQSSLWQQVKEEWRPVGTAS